MKGSKSGHLASSDLKSIGRGVALAGGGAVLTYLIDTVPSVELGEWQPLVVALLSVALNVLRKYLTDTREV